MPRYFIEKDPNHELMWILGIVRRPAFDDLRGLSGVYSVSISTM